jgi:hypothetical protein
VRLALPTYEHFVPVIVSLGAAADPSDAVRFPIAGFWLGSMTRRSAQFGSRNSLCGPEAPKEQSRGSSVLTCEVLLPGFVRTNER